MPAITSIDLDRAKQDVDHIAAIATSLSPTATDRLGNTKKTMLGAVATILAFTDRGAWVTGTSYAVKDLVSNSGTWYVAVVAHVAGATFAGDQASKWRVYQGVLSGDLAAVDGGTLIGFGASNTVDSQLEMMYYGCANVRDPQFAGGAIGDGVADDTAAIQAAINAHTFVFLPDPAVSYKIVGSLQLRNDSRLVGQTGWKGVTGGSTGAHTLVGDGVNPIFVTGTYPGGDGLLNRNIRIENLSMRNNGAQVIDLFTANNFKFINSAFTSYSFSDATKGTINARYSYRGEIRGCWLGASGGAWCVSQYDNCNGWVCSGNVASGGSLGGIADIGQSQSIAWNHTISEVSLKGFRVGASGVTGAGICNGVNLDDNYLEQVGAPYEIATGFIVRGLSIKRGYIGNTSLSLTESPIYTLGRVQNWDIGTSDIARKSGGTAEIFDFQYSASAPLYARNGDATDIIWTGGTGNYMKTTGFPSAAIAGNLFGFNLLQPVSDGPSSGSRAFESTVITANVGQAAMAVIPTTAYGGVVDRIEIFQSTGTLGCTVSVGSSVSATEIQTFDPSALTYVLGAADSGIGATPKLIRAGDYMRLLVTAGAGTGTFRIRIHYRAL